MVITYFLKLIRKWPRCFLRNAEIWVFLNSRKKKNIWEKKKLQSEIWLTLFREIWASQIASWLKMLIMCWQNDWLIRKFKKNIHLKRNVNIELYIKRSSLNKNAAVKPFLFFSMSQNWCMLTILHIQYLFCLYTMVSLIKVNLY